MEKTINIGGKEVTFKFTLAAFYIFKNQFGYDAMVKIVPAIGDIMAGLNAYTLLEAFDEKKSDDNAAFAAVINNFGAILQETFNFEIVDFLNLIWAFAKAYDNKLPAPMQWYSEFDDFPIIDVMMEFAPCLYESLGSKKKWTTTQTTKTMKTGKKEEK
ncbi:hypothetical protein [Anaerococcus sp. AGMB09787]|uniref:hypothetical protein n=1 Tax=Anaerococcus sp. AGMB09787 TaxID=2922869 RepID=UPI001FAEFD27|nr:hypothetical protein [Anaerococcus sp. AGMB09787]